MASQNEGDCRRKPPVVVEYEDGDERLIGTRWPITCRGDWCLEWVAKAPTKAAIELSAYRGSVDSLGLSVRSRNALGRSGVRTIAELCALSPQNLLAQKNFANGSLAEVVSVLAARGLTLRPDPRDVARAEDLDR